MSSNLKIKGIKFIYFDVANTLIYKPNLFPVISRTLRNFGFNTDEVELKKRHKLVSEMIKFPAKTTRNFYNHFNSEFLYAVGIIPTKEIIKKLYENCANLEWQAYPDTKVLKKLSIPIGVISNWDKTLHEKLRNSLDVHVDPVYASADYESKPNLAFFKRAFNSVRFSFKDILYVGDSIKLDYEPALKLGARVLLLDRDNIYPNFSGRKISSLTELSKL